MAAACASRREIFVDRSLFSPGRKYKKCAVSRCVSISDYDQHSRSAIRSVEDFLTLEECCSWIEYGEYLGFERTNQKSTSEYARRQQGRVSFVDEQVAESFFHRLEPLMSEFALLDGLELHGCSSNIRLYKYDTGDCFGKHIDESNMENGSETMFTVLLYLNGHDDGEGLLPSLTGGETKFYKGFGHKDSDLYVSVVPRAGLMLAHRHGQHCLTHEAVEVSKGCKYVLRTDLLYRIPRTVSPSRNNGLGKGRRAKSEQQSISS